MKARRLFSVTLALLMVMSAVPMQVFATAPTVKNSPDVNVEYYVKNIGNEGLDKKELEGHNFTGTASFDTAINENMSLTVGGESLPAKKVIPGYTFHSVHGSSDSTVGNGKNKLRLLYTKDISVTFKSADTNKGTINGATDNALVSTGAVGAALTEPGKSAVLGYEFSHWSTDEAGNNSVTLPSTFPASDVTYYGQWVKDPTQWVTITFKTEEQGTIDGGTTDIEKELLTNNAFPAVPTESANTGYKFDGWYDGSTKVDTFPANATETKTYVAKFIKDEEATNALSYTVEYYRDGNQKESGTGGSAAVWVNDPQVVPVNWSAINTSNKYPGYKLGSVSTPIGTESVADGTVIKVDYVKDETLTHELKYHIEYYKDGTKVKTDTVTGTVWAGQTALEVDPVDKNKYTTDGYKFSHTSPAAWPTGAADNTLKVYYVKDTDAKHLLSYTVQYYKNGVEVTADALTHTESVWVGQSTLKMVTATDPNKYFGYILDETDPATWPLNEQVSSGSKHHVYYVTDPSATNALSYTVEYYLDGEYKEAGTGGSANVWIHDPQVVPVNWSAINTTNQFGTGYKFDSSNHAIDTASVANDTVIKIYYVTDLSVTNALSYTVEYYLDGEYKEAGTGGSANVWVNDPQVVPVNWAAINTTDKFGTGYKFDSSSPATDTESVANGTAIKVYYSADNAVTKKLSYSVRYYLDGELKATVPVEKDVWIHSTTLPVDKEAINTSDYFDGKFFFKTDPATIPDEIAGDGVIEVHYSSNYTIKYVAIVMAGDTEIHRYTIRTDGDLLTNSSILAAPDVHPFPNTTASYWHLGENKDSTHIADEDLPTGIVGDHLSAFTDGTLNYYAIMESEDHEEDGDIRVRHEYYTNGSLTGVLPGADDFYFFTGTSFAHVAEDFLRIRFNQNAWLFPTFGGNTYNHTSTRIIRVPAVEPQMLMRAAALPMENRFVVGGEDITDQLTALAELLNRLEAREGEDAYTAADIDAFMRSGYLLERFSDSTEDLEKELAELQEALSALNDSARPASPEAKPEGTEPPIAEGEDTTDGEGEDGDGILPGEGEDEGDEDHDGDALPPAHDDEDDGDGDTTPPADDDEDEDDDGDTVTLNPVSVRSTRFVPNLRALSATEDEGEEDDGDTAGATDAEGIKARMNAIQNRLGIMLMLEELGPKYGLSEEVDALEELWTDDEFNTSGVEAFNYDPENYSYTIIYTYNRTVYNPGPEDDDDDDGGDNIYTITDSDTPLGETPIITIFDEPIPLVDLPFTGAAVGTAALTAGSWLTAVVVALRRLFEKRRRR